MSMRMFATYKVKTEQIILCMSNRDLYLFFGSELRSSVRISHKSKNFNFRC